jgi:hypothetical protein
MAWPFSPENADLRPPIEKHYARDGKEIGAAPRRLTSVFHVSIAGMAVTAMLAPPMTIQAMVSLAARPTFAAPLRSAKSPGDSLVKNLH